MKHRIRSAGPPPAELEAKRLEAALEEVAKKFRCNRIVTLTGLSKDPNRPGYEYALVDQPEPHS